MLKKNVEKIGKKSEKIRKNNLKMFNYTGIDDILPIFDQSWKKKEDRKILYKLLLTRNMRQLFEFPTISKFKKE